MAETKVFQRSYAEYLKKRISSLSGLESFAMGSTRLPDLTGGGSCECECQCECEAKPEPPQT